MIFSCDGQNDVIDEIVNGNITQTAVYSTCAPDAMILAKKSLRARAMISSLCRKALSSMRTTRRKWSAPGTKPRNVEA